MIFDKILGKLTNMTYKVKQGLMPSERALMEMLRELPAEELKLVRDRINIVLSEKTSKSISPSSQVGTENGSGGGNKYVKRKS